MRLCQIVAIIMTAIGSAKIRAIMKATKRGVQAERNRIKQAVEGSSSSVSKSSTLGSMVGGSIALTIFGWCFVGLPSD